MPLRIELKPFERIVIGESVLINSGTRASFLIDGETPVLREKETVSAETADTPARRLYHCVQTMYLKNDIGRYDAAYAGLIAELRSTCSHSGELVAAVQRHVSAGALYQALKAIRKLMNDEESNREG